MRNSSDSTQKKTASPIKPSSSLAPFSNPVFRSLWFATLISNLGGLIQAVAAGWAMTTLTDSEYMVALVTASTTLPIMALSLVSGVLADNYDRRRIMMVAQTLMLLASLGLTLATYFGVLTPWMLLFFTFLIGSGAALNNPSWQASVGDIVPREQVPAAVMANGMSFNLMRSIGPALGGLVIVAAGVTTAFTLNTVSYLAMILALALWSRPPSERTLPRERFGQAAAAGIRYVGLSPNLLRIILRGSLFGLTGVSVLALLPLVARDALNGSASTYGFLLGFFGIGAVIGALNNARIRAKLNNETIVRSTFIGMALGVLLLSAGHGMLLSAIALLICGACWVTTNALLNVSLQLSTPRWVVGRALSFYMMGNAAGMAGGSWIWGLVAEQHGLQLALMISAATLIVGSIIGYLLPLPEFDRLNLDPLNRFIEPTLAVQLAPQTGPIMVTVDFDIAEHDIPAFLAGMAARRRIRLRDGARRWSLLRDLEHPNIWTEKYYVATWVEYVRHNQRRTVSDSGISETLHALHRGNEPPKVRRMIERQTVPKLAEPHIEGYEEPRFEEVPH
ncbi:MFS transporter [Granulosicoccus antarcticus]|uniref:Enterobactin exporter EntS n=1 Tax=Granulosicoccus antarcticus IMCC3135 TaxID=1192854 RepID=A0A2Z2P2W7_9GAMM|nr:MFS transporter [Granulosicoccus antarcticus]ASJ74074.1 Enterobactin exporter EntS [Granulosicoccus antarcticus IMCC3135]